MCSIGDERLQRREKSGMGGNHGKRSVGKSAGINLGNCVPEWHVLKFQ
jgi:hypothetical protein